MHARLEANLLRGPLTGLSFRKTHPNASKTSVPQPPTNEERYRALLAVLPLTQRNTHPWPFSQVCMTEAEGRQYEREQMMDGPSEIVTSYADRRGI